jgi:Protein of unknown function (DUF1573)
MMNKFVCLLMFLSIIAFRSNAQNKAESLPMDSLLTVPQMVFAGTSYDFGKVRKGEKISTSFHFKNTGAKPLRILTVQVSCGCTVTEYQQTPIEPGKTGEITVVLDTNLMKSTVGKQTKSVLVISNAKVKEVLLSMEGEIVLQ